MPKDRDPKNLIFQRAALEVEAHLREAVGYAPERLDEVRLQADYPQRDFVRGWRMEFEFPDGVARRVDLLLKSGFPAGYPRTALVDRPEPHVWPHIEYDGILCLLPTMAEVDAEDPGAVAVNLLARSARLIEELIEGSIVERDFREEFLTYWFYSSDNDAPRIYSILRPSPPSRLVCVWRDEKGLTIVGEDEPSLKQWLCNRYGVPSRRKTFHIEPAAMLWLPEPPLPAAYPRTGADLIVLARRIGEDAEEILASAAAAIADETLVVMGAEGRAGAGLIAVTTTSAKPARSRTGNVERPLTRGYRDSNLDRAVATLRTYSAAPLLRSTVERADAEWIHGRGKDPRTAILLSRNVTVIGCGSVGSSVASRLARAGVGVLDLVDYDELKWANVGRHELGAESVGLNKAEQLTERLGKNFPHLSITGHPHGAHSIIDDAADLLADSDLVVVATGNWDADAALNRWHLESGRKQPFLYGWAENYATAGHAIVVGRQGGCLRCGVGSTGQPAFQATVWPNGAATLEEPACGNHFNPYGAVELSFVVDLIADTALEALLDPPIASLHRMWLSQSSRLQATGGNWSSHLLNIVHEGFAGGALLIRPWPDGDCRLCSQAMAA